MRKALKLNRCALIYQPHLNLTQSFFTSRLKSDSSKSSDTTTKETECKTNKDAAPDETTKDAVAGKQPKDAAASKPTEGAAASTPTKDAASTNSTKEAEPKKEAPPPKDETIIAGGSKCNPKTPSLPPLDSQSKGKKESCEALLYPKPRKASKRKVPLTKIQGGVIDCKRKSDKKPILANHASQYQKLSLFLALPLIAILTLLIFSHRMEEDRLEFKKYNYMYKREKRFSFGDGNRSAFHNSHYNALPPDGYEDEIDEEGLGEEPETEKDRKSRLKEFQKVFKKWKKHVDKREAEMKKRRSSKILQ